jgi:hypothetical protein
MAVLRFKLRTCWARAEPANERLELVGWRLAGAGERDPSADVVVRVGSSRSELAASAGEVHRLSGAYELDRRQP